MVKRKWDNSKKAEQLRLQNPFGDFDKDRVPNLLDCQPFNPAEHGDMWSSIKQRVTTPIYKRIIPYVKPYVSRVTTIVPQVVKKYAPTISYERAAERREAVIRELKKKKKEIVPLIKRRVVEEIKERIPEREAVVSRVAKIVPPIIISKKIIEQAPRIAKHIERARTRIIVPRKEIALVGRQQQKVEQRALDISRLETQYREERRISPIGEFQSLKTLEIERKYAPQIKDKRFIGTEEQFKTYEREWASAQETDKAKHKEYESKYEKYETEEAKLSKLQVEKQKELREYVTYPTYAKAEKFRKRWEEEVVPGEIRAPYAPLQYFAEFGRGIIRAPGQLVSFAGMIPPAFEYGVRKPAEFKEAFVPGAVVLGAGMVKEAKERPAEFTGEMIGMGLITGGIGRGIRIAKPYVSRISPRYIAPKKITPTPIIREKMPSTARMPLKTPAEIMKLRMEEPTFKLTGEPGEVWHAAPIRWKPTILGEIAARPGAAPVKGIYVGPEAYPKFAGISAIIEAPRRIPVRPTRPTLYSIMAGKVKIPKEVKVTKTEITTAKKLLGRRAPTEEAVIRFARYKKYVEEIAPKEAAYISPEVTAKIPWRGVLEVEAVIPVGARMVEPIISRIFPRFTYVKVPKYKFTRAGKKVVKELYKSQQERLQAAKIAFAAEKLRLAKTKIPKELEKYQETFIQEEAKLFEKLKKSGDLKEVGYEPTKLEIRKLVMKADEISPVERLIGKELIGRPKIKERFEPIRRVPREERFRPGEYIVRRPTRRVPITTPAAMFGIRPRSARERRRERERSIRRLTTLLREREIPLRREIIPKREIPRERIPIIRIMPTRRMPERKIPPREKRVLERIPERPFERLFERIPERRVLPIITTIPTRTVTIPKSKKIKKKKIPKIKRVEIGAFKYGEITPVAMPKEALGLLGVGTVKKGKYVYNPKDTVEFITGKKQ